MGSVRSHYENLDHSHFDDPGQVHCPSDCESVVSGAQLDRPRPRPSGEGLITVCDGDRVYRAMEMKLVSGLSAHGIIARVEAVRRLDYTFDHPMTRARIQSFVAYSKAVGMKCGRDPDASIVKYGWFGGSKDDIDVVLSNGFGCPNSDGTHGEGVYLSPIDLPAQSLELATPDDDGLQHMLICRVILGKTEVVSPGSDQDNPSTDEFDCGVDDLVSPNKYIVWTSRMNTHILPEFVVSFRTCSFGAGSPRKEPSSDWMPLQNLITVLSKYIPSDALELIKKHHCDFKKQKITRIDMIQRLRHIAGDKLLATILKSLKGKMKGLIFNGQQSNKRT